MNTVTPEDGNATRQRRRLITTVKDALRELRVQLSVLNHQVGAQLEVKDVDFDCLDLINIYGPLSPSTLARHAGLHPATMTGILDRLERGGWVVRERDSDDRRAVLVRALRDRNAEAFRVYAPMNTSLDQICSDYNNAELELIADFLRRTTHAGRNAAAELGGG
jgi:DNA-binding MarR family transcriptional regulator